MPRNATKAADNVFYLARKAAEKCNVHLGIREGAAEETGIDRTRLARIEAGVLVPYPEEVLMMAHAYQAPQLCNHYCASLCPLGKKTIPPCELLQIDRLALKVMSAMQGASCVQQIILEIAGDGQITQDEVPQLEQVMKNLETMERASMEGLKKSMGSVQYAGQFQQTPAPAEGIIFKRDWMNQQFTKKSLPYLSMIIQSWDMAFTKSEGSAKVAGFTMARAGSNIYILDLENDKMTFTESVAAVRRLSGKWPRARAKVVENKANGPAIVDLLKKEIPGMVEFNPKGSKEERAISITPYFEAGNIWFPDPKEAPWVNDLIRDLLIFPKGTFKDTVDALVQGILYLMDKPAVTGPPQAMDNLTKESYWRT